MNLIEALKQANGNPVRRKLWETDPCGVGENEGLICLRLRNPIWSVTKEDVVMTHEILLADDWYVVEPKSKIEEAIEREAIEYFTGDKPYATHSEYAKVIRRIVNLTLDEAKKAAWGNNLSMCDGDMGRCVLAPQSVGERIDALRVKE